MLLVSFAQRKAKSVKEVKKNSKQRFTIVFIVNAVSEKE